MVLDTVAYTIEKGKANLWTISATIGTSTSTLTAGSGYKNRILYGYIKLTTDATVANRYLKILVVNSTPSTICDMGASTTAVTASQTKYFSIAPIAALSASGWGLNTTSSYGAIGILQLAEPLEIFDTDRLNVSIQGGVAGDSYEGFVKYIKTKL